MQASIAKELVRSMLERMHELLEVKDNRACGLISSRELLAIQTLLDVTEPQVTEEGGPSQEQSTLSGSSTRKQEPPDTNQPKFANKPLIGDRSQEVRLNDAALSATKTKSDYVLCFDFGTAKSKAFCAKQDALTSRDPELIDLGLGEADEDWDNSFYALASCLWIEEDGRVFAGSEAMHRSVKISGNSTSRRRIDSLKQKLTLQGSSKIDPSSELLDASENPTHVSFSTQDAIIFYLAYLTDLAGNEIEQEERSLGRYLQRTFTIPAWDRSQRQWIEPLLEKYFLAAQIVGDSFHGRWDSGIDIHLAKSIISKAFDLTSRCTHLLQNRKTKAGYSQSAILEPIAAGGARIWVDRGSRDLMLVVDVGAGTTDFSLFFVLQKPGNQRTAHQVNPPGTSAIRLAGDVLDSALLGLILDKAARTADETVRKRMELNLRLQSLRRFKEQLFQLGSVKLNLITDEILEVTLDEYLASDMVKRFEVNLKAKLQELLSLADGSWSRFPQPQIVFTGGGAALPMIQGLGDHNWNIGGRSVRFNRLPLVPQFIQSNFSPEFQKEYPQLAVAIGGSLPALDEGRDYSICAVNAPAPSLEKKWI